MDRVEVLEVTGSLERDVTALAYDSRRVVPGGVFVAIPGYHADGHRFIGDALARGAGAVVHEARTAPDPRATFVRVPDSRLALARLATAFYGDPSRQLRLIGVTGTNGKTTTTYLLRAVLEAWGEPAGLVGTIGYRIGARELPAPQTTPEASDLQALLREMVRAGHRYGVMEVSSHALALHRVEGCRFAAGVFTNFTQDHLDFHGTMEAYFQAKSRLFTGLAPDALAVLNVHDTRSRQLAAMTPARILTYGFSDGADVRGDGLEVSPEGIRLEVLTPEGRVELRSPLLGRHNALNVLAATAAAVGLGVSLEAVQQGVASLPGVPGRLERVEMGQGFVVAVDYAHTADALARVMAAARELTRGRLVVLFGCGGNRDRSKRPLMGQVAAQEADRVILTSDNPRDEDPLAILREIEAGIQPLGKVRGRDYWVIPDRREAIFEAIRMARPGDFVLLAGKGHETYQIVGPRKLPFDDRQVAAEALRSAGCTLRGSSGGAAC